MKTILAWMALGTAIFISAEITTARGATATLAWDPNSEPDVSGYRLYYGTSSRNYTTTIDVGKVTTATVTGLVAGSSYFFAVTAYNTAALESGFSSEISYTVPAASPPAIVLGSPPPGSAYSAPANIAITANVTLNGHTATKVQFYNGTTLLGEDTTSPYTFTLSNAGAGNYSLLARLVYDAGSTLDSATANVTVVNPAPVIGLASPANGASYSAPANIPIAANVTLNGHTATKVQFYNGTSLLGEATTSPYTVSLSNAGAGNYSLFARLVYDAGSTLDSATANVTVVNPSPIIGLASPTNSASYSTPANIAISANVTLNGHTAAKVQFYNGTTLLGEDTTSPYSFTLINAGAGSYSLFARLVYDAGSTLDSAVASVTVANPAPLIALSSPAAGSSYAAPANIDLTASVTQNGHTVTKVQFYANGTFVSECTAVPYSCTWSNVNTGNYSLVAHLLFDASGALDSSPVNVSVTGLPLPWLSKDVGTVTAASMAAFSNNVYTIAGSGNIGGSMDSFRFAWQNLSGDGEIKAQITSTSSTGSAARIGVMIRETLNSDSVCAFMGINSSGTYRWQRRLNTGSGTSSTTSSSGTPPNTWVRLLRKGSTLYGYKSSDGITWTLVNSRNISMAPNIYIGLAVASGSSTVINSSTFSNVSVVP